MPITYKHPYIVHPDYKHNYTPEEIKELMRCSQDVVYFAENFYTIIDADPNAKETEKIIELYEFQHKMLRSFQNNQFNILLSSRQIGKALDIETDIITENGYKKLKDIKVGDYIFTPKGKKTRVNYITETMYNHEVYDVEFDNGEIIKADKDHLWKISHVDLSRKDEKYTIATTEEIIPIYNKLMSRSKPATVYVDKTDCLDFEHKEVDIDPYLLGLWLGDGNKNDGRITCSVEDYDEYKNILENKGYRISKFRPDKRRDTTGNFNIYGLSTTLRKLNLYRNKHIPVDYIINSKHIRLEVLRGLLDSDGYCNVKGTCQFYQSDEKIFNDFIRLISTLGIKTKTTLKKTTRKDCNIATFISNEYELFKLYRKLKRQVSISNNHQKNSRLYIRSIKKCDSVPVRCLQVEDEEHLFLCGNRLVPTHNTTVSCIYLLWFAIFNDNKEIGILANQHSTAMEIVGDIKKAYELLPPFLKPGVVEYNKTNIEFSNGAKIFAKATSADALRGHTMSLVFLDEFAFVPQNIASQFWASNYPTISKSNGKIIIVSTPNGNAGLYYETWQKAINKQNKFVPIKVNWWEVPGRDDAWKEETIANVGLLTFNQEYGASFTGSSQTLIDGETLEKLGIGVDHNYEQEFGNLLLWKKPERGHIYGFGVDVSPGTFGDYSVINIFDITYFNKSGRYEQVGIYRSNAIKVMDFAEIVYKLGKEWNNAAIIVEVNEAGYGGILVEALREKEYELLFYDHDKGAYGVNANRGTKPPALTHFKHDVENGKCVLHDKTTLNELRSFEEVKPGVFKARVGDFHDDTVAASYWMSFMLRSRWWNVNCEYMLESQNIKLDDNLPETSYEESFSSFLDGEGGYYDQLDEFTRELMED